MASIPGKSCGSCTMCCKVLEIEHFNKPMGDWCVHCIHTGGCKVYLDRPKVCRDYECEWMMERALPPTMRPDKVGTILMEEPDSGEYRAVCDPENQFGWRHPLVFRHLVAKAKAGRVVVAKAGMKAWRIYESGRWAVYSG